MFDCFHGRVTCRIVLGFRKRSGIQRRHGEANPLMVEGSFEVLQTGRMRITGKIVDNGLSAAKRCDGTTQITAPTYSKNPSGVEVEFLYKTRKIHSEVGEYSVVLSV
ncbi:hypothetical protein AcV5_009712 [Taiwanofungus camphoratus]|nr:hypothetical protein AcV5_009712 [Antrodia cinnamomea]